MSNSEVIAEIKKEDKKPKKIFYIVMACSVVIGFLLGFGSGYLDEAGFIDNWSVILLNGLDVVSVYAGFVFTLISTIIVSIFYRKGRKAYASWDEEDETVLNQIEMKLNMALVIANVNLVITSLFLSIGFSYLLDFETNGLPEIYEVLIFLIGYVWASVLGMYGSSKIVNFMKEINPEKKGSVYDFSFQRIWMESSDEAEKLLTYKASYTAYRNVNIVCFVLWLLCSMNAVLLNGESWPIVIIGIVWLTNYLSCNIEALRLSKHAARIQE